MQPVQSITADIIATHLVHTLTATDGLNAFFENAIPQLAEVFGADRALLIDYRETTGRFVLMHWFGYPGRSRFDLQHQAAQLEVQRALEDNEPFYSVGNRNRLYVPLYFVNTLESVIVFEAAVPIELTPLRRDIARMMSKFIGMMMSSNRMLFNQVGLIDLDDLHRARQIQLTYLPVSSLETEHYEVYGYNESSALVGGDYFDYFRLRERSLQCVLADASGHGLSAALIMSAFRAMLHSEIDEMKDCGELFTALNRSVHTGSSTVQYLTSVFIDFDEDAKRLKYANAGHFEPAIIRTDATLRRLAGGGPPLGMFGHSRYASIEAEICPGDLLVMFTDGFTDLRNASDDFFGEQRILDIVREHRTRPLNEIASVLLNEGTAFSVAPKPEDDLTLFLLRFR
jgi:hypothetical protein